MENVSFAKLPSDKVVEACRLYLKYVDSKNRMNIELKIDEYLSYGPIRRFFSFLTFKPLTREQALEEMKRPCAGIITDHYKITGHGRWWKTGVENLLLLASNSDEVNVPSELFSEIAYFYDKKD